MGENQAHAGWVFSRRSWVFLCSFAVISALVVIAQLLGVRIYYITSGSMSPTIPEGSIILTIRVPAESLSVGEIITTQRGADTRVVTHRVVELRDNDGVTVWLQGDANSRRDAAPYTLEMAQLYVATLFG